MFPHERSLVTKYEGRPFALLGVNGDDSREALRKAQEKHHLNWRSWWDEGNTITGQWKVRGYPTLFLIDHKGVVRWKSEGPPKNHEMEQLIEKLVKDAESETSKTAFLRRDSEPGR